MGETFTVKHRGFSNRYFMNKAPFFHEKNGVFFWCLLIIYLLILSERKGKTFEVHNDDISEENYDRKIWVDRDPRHFKRNA
jgi:hypothetical protein